MKKIFYVGLMQVAGLAVGAMPAQATASSVCNVTGVKLGQASGCVSADYNSTTVTTSSAAVSSTAGGAYTSVAAGPGVAILPASGLTSSGLVCRWIDNTSSNVYFVPMNTATEWGSFIAHAPAGTSLVPCALPKSIIGSALTSSPTSGVTATTDTVTVAPPYSSCTSASLAAPSVYGRSSVSYWPSSPYTPSFTCHSGATTVTSRISFSALDPSWTISATDGRATFSPDLVFTGTANGTTGTSLTVNEGTAVTLAWGTTNASSCTASGSWSGGVAVNGSTSVTAASAPGTYTYALSCANAAGLSSSANVLVTVLTPTNGACGTIASACTSGTSQNTYNNGTTTTWVCTGTNGGTTASCSVGNGGCGSDSGQSLTTTPSNLCASGGTSSSFVGNSAGWSWSCSTGSGSNVSCGTSLTAPVCGTASIKSGTVTGTLCTVGTASSVGSDGSYTCMTGSGTATKTANCAATVEPAASCSGQKLFTSAGTFSATDEKTCYPLLLRVVAIGGGGGGSDFTGGSSGFVTTLSTLLNEPVTASVKVGSGGAFKASGTSSLFTMSDGSATLVASGGGYSSSGQSGGGGSGSTQKDSCAGDGGTNGSNGQNGYMSDSSAHKGLSGQGYFVIASNLGTNNYANNCNKGPSGRLTMSVSSSTIQGSNGSSALTFLSTLFKAGLGGEGGHDSGWNGYASSEGRVRNGFTGQGYGAGGTSGSWTSGGGRYGAGGGGGLIIGDSQPDGGNVSLQGGPGLQGAVYAEWSPLGTTSYAASCGSTLATCSAGTVANYGVSGDTGSWSCVGYNGGASASCSMCIPQKNADGSVTTWTEYQACTVNTVDSCGTVLDSYTDQGCT